MLVSSSFGVKWKNLRRQGNHCLGSSVSHVIDHHELFVKPFMHSLSIICPQISQLVAQQLMLKIGVSGGVDELWVVVELVGLNVLCSAIDDLPTRLHESRSPNAGKLQSMKVRYGRWSFDDVHCCQVVTDDCEEVFDSAQNGSNSRNCNSLGARG